MTPREWFELLYGEFEPGTWLTLFSADSESGSKDTDWSPVDDLDLLARHVERRAPTRDVWFGVATRVQELDKGRRGSAEDCDAVPALWVDIDIAGPGHQTTAPLPTSVDEAIKLIRSFPIPPSIIVHSGGGLQPWWIFDEPVRGQVATDLLARWGATWQKLGADLGWHVDSVFDITRVMRVPGTFNRKGEPVEVKVVDQSDWRYSVDEIEQWTIDPPAEPERTLAQPYEGVDRPGDSFNLSHSGNEILGSLGWNEPHPGHGGDRHWRRPGKDRGMASATVYADGHTTIWSETTAAESGCETFRPYDPFGLYVALVHRGDFATATSELRGKGYGAPLERDDLRALLPSTRSSALAQPSAPIDEATIEWGEIVPLIGQADPPPFPLATLPGWITDHAQSAADQLQVPVDLCVQVAIGALATVTAGRTRVEVVDGWTENLNLYLATAMGSGAGKSPADKKMAGALKMFAKERREQMEAEISEKELKRDLLAKQLEAAKGAAAKPGGDVDEAIRIHKLLQSAPPPPSSRMLVDDATPEALTELLFRHGGCLAIVSSEAALLDVICGAYSPKVNLDVFLKAWGGDQIIVDRKGGGDRAPTQIDIPEALLTIAVTVQPHHLAELRKHPELAGRGFTARFMYSMPRDLRGFRDRSKVKSTVNRAAKERYESLFLRIARDQASRESPVTLAMTDAASEMFIQWEQRIESRIRPGGDLQHLTEWVAKQQASVVRMAGLIHVAEQRSYHDPIDVDIMGRAIQIGDYWAGHASAVAELWQADEGTNLAMRVLEWLQTRKAGACSNVSLRELHQGLRRSVSSSADLIAPMVMLEDHGYVSPLFQGPPKTGKGTKSPEWALNPALCEDSEDCEPIEGVMKEIFSPTPSPPHPLYPASQSSPSSQVVEELEPSQPADEPQEDEGQGAPAAYVADDSDSDSDGYDGNLF